MKKLIKESLFSFIAKRNILKIIFVITLTSFFFLISAPGFAANGDSQDIKQTVNVTGTLTSSSGEILLGVTIFVKGTEIGTISRVDGTYSIDVPDANSVLVFSYIGYVTQEVAINGRSVVDVVLEESLESLEEVIVVGYGTQRKANLTGAVDHVTSEAFENRTMTNLTQGLQGVMPNLNIKL
ncbi:MAG: carboxypeptidase-like regulatory domain-containing protein, partial [Bacteroidales bacterium]|nr:carboxypeptidase-like regulatory domain-containing protein [Bacteroidales bacterium]